MLKKNDEYICRIESNGAGGEGVCHIDGFTIFVPGTVAGDEVKVKILKVLSGYAFGKAEEIIFPSVYRTEPKCSKASRCGGCDIAHIDYDYQLKIKRDIVVSALERIGKIKDAEVGETVGMDKPFFYRNKMQFPVGLDKEGKITYGFYAKRSHNIVSAEECVTGKQYCKPILDAIVSYMEETGVSPYDEFLHKGIVRHVFIRDSVLTGEIMVVLCINADGLPNTDVLVEKLLVTEKNISGILLNINKKKTNLIMGEKNVLLFGKDYITDSIGKFKFKISPHSFYQINPVQTEKLYQLAAECAGDLKDKVVFDLYCGAGTISLFLSEKAKKVYGVEIVPEAVENAHENAKTNGIKNAEFVCGDVQKIIEEIYDTGVRADVVVMDPPRKGSDEKTLNIILDMKPEKIVYVSCNPATLARDLRVLEDGGYKTEKVTPVDMFPHTCHVECVALLCRK